ncbi:hypothetical protein [Haloglomus halophilum]|uniref:hypothetical protein n=1 Tax=Haloglomus halophilum TaxID=2962672 RepID=UPI0020C9F81E|nr:hypothetical protein [Haloglomus halophilum]
MNADDARYVSHARQPRRAPPVRYAVAMAAVPVVAVAVAAFPAVSAVMVAVAAVLVASRGRPRGD